MNEDGQWYLGLGEGQRKVQELQMTRRVVEPRVSNSADIVVPQGATQSLQAPGASDLM